MLNPVAAGKATQTTTVQITHVFMLQITPSCAILIPVRILLVI